MMAQAPASHEDARTLPASTASLPDLPEDIFMMVLDHLRIWDVACCQLVSRAWRHTFYKLEYIQRALKRYPSARELRDLVSDTGDQDEATEVAWKKTFDSIAWRYYHISLGKARSVDRYKLAPSEQTGHYYPIGQWDYHESQPGGRLYYENAATHLRRLNNAKPYLFRASLWSYSDGLLVFAPAESHDAVKSTRILALLDLNTGLSFSVPFDISSKIVRNIRLHHRTLIVEWAERDPFHNLNDMEQVNRHFASCYDIRSSVRSAHGPVQWTIEHRSEFKLHFLGLPLSSRDRFFSTHTSSHYAIYFFQPNRSMYSGDEDNPIESLFVWDISKSSGYLPSQDPSGILRPHDSAQGPQIVAVYPFTSLEFLGIRQQSQIRLMSLSLDSSAANLTWRENIRLAGQGYFDPAERLWCAKTTSFPFIGHGPQLQREWDGSLPPYRGHGSMESVDIDEASMEKWFLPIMDVVDDVTGVRLSLVETCFSGLSMMDNRLIVRIKVPWLDEDHEDGEYVVLKDDELSREISAMGRIAGDERWIIGQNEKLELVVLKF
jgi:F-box domain